MCIYMSIYIYVYVRMYVRTYLHTYIPTYLHYIPTYLHPYMHTCIHAYIHVHDLPLNVVANVVDGSLLSFSCWAKKLLDLPRYFGSLGISTSWGTRFWKRAPQNPSGSLVGGLEHDCCFSILLGMEKSSQNDEFICFTGVETTNQI